MAEGFKFESVNILGVPVRLVSKDRLLEWVTHRVKARDNVVLQYVNIHGINLALNDPHYLQWLQTADLVYCDGQGVRLAAQILGASVPEQIALTRWIWDLAALCEKENFKIFLLGGKPGVAEKGSENLKARYPKLKIAGTFHGYFNRFSAENDKVIENIRQSNPDILIVGFGSTGQEEWIKNNRAKIVSPLVMPGGAVIDYLAGRLGKVPDWMIRFRLEWFFRWLEEPVRLFRRYFIGAPYFFWKVLVQRLRTR